MAVLKFQIEICSSVFLCCEKQRGIVVPAVSLALAVLQADAAICKQLLNHTGREAFSKALKKRIVLPENKSTFLIAA